MKPQTTKNPITHKYSLAYLTVPGTDPVTQIRIAREAGFDLVSLRTIPMHLPGEPEFLLHRDAGLFEAVRNALDEYGIALNDIELARIRPDLDITEYAEAFRAAQKLGATDVLGSVWTRDRAFYTKTAVAVSRMARDCGLTYNIEFLPWAGVRNLQECITLIDDIRAAGCDNARIMVDTLHAGRSGVTREELSRTDRSYFGFMHICDGPAGGDGDPVLNDILDPLMIETAREARLYPGDGVMDVKGMVDAVGSRVLSIELPNIAALKRVGAQEHARMCLVRAKNCIESQ